VYNPYVNSGRTRVSGFDFDASGRFKFMDTDFRLKLDGTYVWKYQNYSQALGAYDENIAGTWDFGTPGSRLSTVTKLFMKKGNFDHSITMNYQSGAGNNSNSSPTYCVTQKVAPENMDTCNHVDSNITFDYSLTYSGIDHVKLSLFVNNVFEKDYPITWRDGYVTQFRRVSVAATYKF
jgi:iron complex outermembrane receptor protein